MSEQQFSFDQIIERYIQIRAEKEQITAEMKAKVAAVDKKLDVIEAYLLQTLSASGVESMRTKVGTCYKHLKTNVSVADKEVFLKYLKEHDDLTLLTVSANKTRVLEILEETGNLVPGLSISRTVTVGIRKGTSIGN